MTLRFISSFAVALVVVLQISCARPHTINSAADLPAPIGSTPAEMRFEAQIRNQAQRKTKIGSMLVEVRNLPLPGQQRYGVVALRKDSAGRLLRRHESARLDSILIVDSLPEGVHRVFVTAAASNGAEIFIPIDAGCRTSVVLYVEQQAVGTRAISAGVVEAPRARHTIIRCGR